MSMLTSSQYLQSDYLQPLPTTLDAKNSPLALLAQTCNNIGKDPSGSNKSLIPPIEKDKKKDGSSTGDKTSSSQDNRDSVHSRSGSVPIPSHTVGKEKSSLSLDSQKHSGGSPFKLDLSLKSSERKLSPPSSSAALVGLVKREQGDSRENSSSNRPRSLSPKERESKSREGYRPSSSSAAAMSEKLGIYGTTSSHLSSNSVSGGVHVSSAHLNGLSKPEASLSSLAGGISPYPPHLLLPGYHSLNGYPLPGGLASASTAAILAAHKHNPESVRYTSVKTVSGSTTVVPVCSDPYCTYCKVTLQSAQLAPACSSGCAQCSNDKAAAVGLSASYPSTSLASSLLGMSSLHGLSAAYGMPSSHGAAAGHYVCSWIGSTGFCGKRFSSSEELVQHLRSHTATLDTPVPTLPTGLPLSSLASHGLASHLYPSGLGSVSPTSLRQHYPRSLSPTLLAASRFHPYLKSSLSSLPSALDSSGLPPVHPSLGAYSSLYSLYGHKLGVP